MTFFVYVVSTFVVVVCAVVVALIFREFSKWRQLRDFQSWRRRELDLGLRALRSGDEEQARTAALTFGALGRVENVPEFLSVAESETVDPSLKDDVDTALRRAGARI